MNKTQCTGTSKKHGQQCKIMLSVGKGHRCRYHQESSSKVTKPTRSSKKTTRSTPAGKKEANVVLPVEFTAEKYDPVAAAKCLAKSNYVVIPFIPPSHLPALRKEFDRFLTEMPEYRQAAPGIAPTELHTLDLTNEEVDQVVQLSGNNWGKFAGQPLIHVLGGFAALGNPSSFHHPFIRTLREWAFAHTYPIFGEFENARSKHKSEEKHNRPFDRNLELLFDRVMFRRVGQVPSKESWHRDTTPTNPKSIARAQTGDDIFGGWINLDTHDQFFSAVPSTAVPGDPALDYYGGFEMIPDEEVATAKAYRASNPPIKIPPGHKIIFFQNMTHEVVGKKVKHVMYRLFTGYRLTSDSNTLIQQLDRMIDEQDTVPLKSGQHPPLYAANHVSFHKWKLTVPWSISTVDPRLLVVKKSGPKTKTPNIKYPIAIRHLKSLQHYGFPLYKKYDAAEKQIYHPARSHGLLKPGSFKKEKYKL